MSYNRSTPPGSYTFTVPGFTRGVKVLIVATASVFLLQYLFPALNVFLTSWFALIPGQVVRGAVWQLVSYLFLHAGWGHLFWNMFPLWMFGVAVEQALGTRRFYQFYFLCGAGAGLVDTVLHLLLRPGVPTFTVGASGAIYGVLLAFGMLFPDQPVFLLLPPVTIKAKWLVLGYGVLEFIFTFGAVDHVSHFAHLGGMFFAFLYLKGRFPMGRLRDEYQRWRRRRLQRRFEVYMSKRDRRPNGGDPWVH